MNDSRKRWKSDSQARKFALRRLARDYKECCDNPLPTVAAKPVSEENFLRWHGNVTAPPGSPLAGHYFHIEMNFPDTYPRDSPQVRILTKIRHYNVFNDHQYLCIDMLEGEWEDNHIEHGSRQKMYTGWSAAYSVQSILVQLQAFLCDPELLFSNEASKCYAKAYTCSECNHTNEKPSPFPMASVGGEDDESDGGKSAVDFEMTDDISEGQSANSSSGGFPSDSASSSGSSSSNAAKMEMEVERKQAPWKDEKFNDVPDDVLQVLFAYLDPRTLEHLASFSERFHKIRSERTNVDWIRSELQCFFSKLSYKEEILGVGLTLEYYPRKRQIKSIAPTLDLLGWTAYRDLDQRKGVWKEEFTDFLPLYLSSAHGKRSLPRALEEIRKISGASSDVEAVLIVLPKLLNTMVVNTMNGGLHESIRALQGYCYFNHLFLALCKWKPEIRKEVDRRIGDFLGVPKNRTKRACPALGDWITMLLVSDKYSWKDVRDTYLLENFNRNVLWIQKKFPDYCNKDLSLNYRRNYARVGTDVSRKLAMFHVMFLKMLREDNGKRLSISQTKRRLDKTYGRPDVDTERAIQPKVKEIKNARTWEDFFKGVDQTPMEDEELDAWLIDAMHNSINCGYHHMPRHKRLPPRKHKSNHSSSSSTSSSSGNRDKRHDRDNKHRRDDGGRGGCQSSRSSGYRHGHSSSARRDGSRYSPYGGGGHRTGGYY